VGVFPRTKKKKKEAQLNKKKIAILFRYTEGGPPNNFKVVKRKFNIQKLLQKQPLLNNLLKIIFLKV